MIFLFLCEAKNFLEIHGCNCFVIYNIMGLEIKWDRWHCIFRVYIFAKFVRFQHNSVWKFDRVYVEFAENADH